EWAGRGAENALSTRRARCAYAAIHRTSGTRDDRALDGPDEIDRPRAPAGPDAWRARRDRSRRGADRSPPRHLPREPHVRQSLRPLPGRERGRVAIRERPTGRQDWLAVRHAATGDHRVSLSAEAGPALSGEAPEQALPHRSLRADRRDPRDAGASLLPEHP